ncbi:MAG: tRNA (adenosine(37)-N6)-dimethylallyltransferase MiaA [Anaerolineae bacterium]|nr:tRNA (adenosine(37)-N6)-dimethylallyltransferase MiaA [Anaerolineae bacterium]
MSEQHPPLVLIAGPTAVGKTAVGIHIARALGGEIVSADSRQVYKGMDIGTAKPAQEELIQVRHHLVDIINPDVWLSLADFQAGAYAAIDQILAAGKLPLLVGGTGQYVKAVIEGWGIPHVPPHPALRADLETFADIYGATALHAWLAKVDPAAGQSIDWRNVRRVVRALEVYLISGQPISVLQTRRPRPYRILQIGLTRDRQSLYQRVDARIEQMIDCGLVEEVERLVKAGYGWDLPSMSSLGYSEIGAYLRGECSLDDAVARIKHDTRVFIRKQYNWFRLEDPRMVWFDLERESPDMVLGVVRCWLEAENQSGGKQACN